jgi:hypothetical protein
MPFGSRLRVFLIHQIAPGDRETKEIPMNARSNLITALLTLSLIGPAVAGAQIPDASPAAPKQPKIHLHTLKASYPAAGARAYTNWGAYVYGGASTKVAKAITSAAKTNHTAAPSGNSCATEAQYRPAC